MARPKPRSRKAVVAAAGKGKRSAPAKAKAPAPKAAVRNAAAKAQGKAGAKRASAKAKDPKTNAGITPRKATSAKRTPLRPGMRKGATMDRKKSGANKAKGGGTAKRAVESKPAVRKSTAKKAAPGKASKPVSHKPVKKKPVAKAAPARKKPVNAPAVKKNAAAHPTAPVRATATKEPTTAKPAKPLRPAVATGAATTKAKLAPAPPTPAQHSTAPQHGATTPLAALKQRFQLEFYMNASPATLFEVISTPSGFSEWFCDDVNVTEGLYHFKWGDETESALCIAQRPGEFMRFRWTEDIQEDPGAFFELRIRVDTMTNETCLVVTDHAWPRDVEEERALWESQVHTLMRVLGA